MDNDYLAHVLVNEQVVKREEGWGPWITIILLMFSSTSYWSGGGGRGPWITIMAKSN